jgi:hypothetical protein
LLFGLVHDSLHIRLALSAPIRLLDAFVALPADLVVFQGITVTSKETVGRTGDQRTRGLASSPHLTAQDVEDVLSQRGDTLGGHRGMDR